MSDHTQQHRPNPMIWDNDDQAEGVLAPLERDPLATSDPLGLSDTPSLVGLASDNDNKSRDPMALGDAISNTAVVNILADITDALKRACEENRASRISLDQMSDEDRQILFDALGEGEVDVMISPGNDTEGHAQIAETALPGVWRGRAHSADQSLRVDWIEVADAPLALRKAAMERPRLNLDIDNLEAPNGTMNVMGILAEIDEKSQAWKPGVDTHVINFTLFPMTPADSAYLSKTLAEVGVRVMSGGYGVARVIMTAVPHVWAVQFLNGMGTTILDTIEIGDIPRCVLAAPEDFEDSWQRLIQLREAYDA